MTPNHDPVLEALRGLPALSPDAARATRTRARCREYLCGRSRRRRMAMRLLDGATAAALCAYLVAVFHAAFRLAIGGSAVLR